MITSIIIISYDHDAILNAEKMNCVFKYFIYLSFVHVPQ